MGVNYKNRLSRFITLLSEAAPQGVALIASNPFVTKSHDQFYPYRANSNLFYLTGSTREDLLLIIFANKAKKPVLIAPPVDKVRVLWDGPSEAPGPLASRIGAELVVSENFIKETLTRIRGARTLYTQNISGMKSWKVAEQILSHRGDTQSPYPVSICQLDLLTQHLRLYKDKEEVRSIIEAARVTTNAIEYARPLMIPGRKEYEIAAAIEHYFAASHGTAAFQSIIAAGKNAAVLHYHKNDATLKKGEFLLIDVGAEVAMYAGDISRTIPVGEVSPSLMRLHAAVDEARKAAIKKVRHGVKIASVYEAAAEILLEALIELRVLKGGHKKLMKEKAYKPYFPHGIGHSLGLDVHDIGELRGNTDATLKEGMVFTIEPGLYFSKGVGKIPACGIRIEDDILVQRTGAKILSASVP